MRWIALTIGVGCLGFAVYVAMTADPVVTMSGLREQPWGVSNFTAAAAVLGFSIAGGLSILGACLLNQRAKSIGLIDLATETDPVESNIEVQ